MASIENQARQWLEIMQRNAPKPAPRREVTTDGPEHDELGRAVHYSLKDHPPGSVIQSKVLVDEGRTGYDPERHGEIPMNSPGFCMECDFEFVLKSAFDQHLQDAHDGQRFMWSHKRGFFPKAIVRNNSLKPTKSAHIDPHGRIIKGTPGQLREEAKRHGVIIQDGPGAD